MLAIRLLLGGIYRIVSRMLLQSSCGYACHLFKDYWQLRCQIGLSREEKIDALLLRLQQDYQGSLWTASAQTAVKDFKWQQENRSLK